MTPTPGFLLMGEPLALDLVNTRVRHNGAALDLLETPAALTMWLRRERGRVAWTGAASAADLTAVLGLRDAIARLLCATREHTRPPKPALDKVNRALAWPMARPRLGWSASEPHLVPPAPDSQRRALLHVLAADAATLLTGPQAERLRQCAHPDCILQFVARNPRRRWCSDSVCGNRARVARHYLHQHRTH